MSTPFGHAMRRHFLFSPTHRPLNHGSWGAFPRPVRDAQRALQDELEAAPDLFLRYRFGGLLDASRAALAALLRLPVDEIVLVQNATVGTNTVLRAIAWRPGDVILCFETVYHALDNTIRYICESTPAEVQVVPRAWPCGDRELVDAFAEAVRRVDDGLGKQGERRRVRMACFDTVSSIPGVRVPWEALVGKCRELGVLSCVDGAHGVGMVELGIGEVRPDFLVSNLHKWLFVPRGCAVFYVPLANQHLIRSSVPTSEAYMPPSQERPNVANENHWMKATSANLFVEQHKYVGTKDVSNYLTVPAALAFRRDVCGGEDAIMAYCAAVAQDGAREMATILGTEVMDNEERTLTRCAMANVRLPLGVGEGEGEVPEPELMRAWEWFTTTVAREAETYLAVNVYRGRWWVRVCGQVYLEVEDFRWAGELLLGMCARVGKGEYKIAGAEDGVGKLSLADEKLREADGARG